MATQAPMSFVIGGGQNGVDESAGKQIEEQPRWTN